MSSNVLPPNPCLVAILLVVKINAEPRIVFHYPPRPGKDNTHITRYLAAQEKEKDGSSSTDDDSSTSHDEIAVDNDNPKESKTGVNTPELDVEDPASVSPEKNAMWDSQYGKTKWSDLFGLPSAGLARLLCPPPSSDKQKFEMSIDDKVFVGRPVFARDGDSWQKKKTERKAKAKSAAIDDKPTEARARGTASEPTLGQDEHASTDALEHESDHSEARKSRQPNLTAAHRGHSNKTGIEMNTQAEQSKVSKEVLNMFHVVFVLNPPPLEYQLRVKEMYDHVVRKFSKALKWAQARSNYVLREASLLYTEAPLMKRAHGKVKLSGRSGSADDAKPRTSHWPVCIIDIGLALFLPKPSLLSTTVYLPLASPTSISLNPLLCPSRSPSQLPFLSCLDLCRTRCQVSG